MGQISIGVDIKVEFKNGQVGWYGSTTTAANAGRVIPGGKTQPLTWMLVRQEDRVGNTVLYNYQSFGDGETLPSTIQYTGYTSTAGTRSLTFAYELRPTASLGGDQSTTYLSGGVIRQTRRLTNILTKVGTENVRDYRLVYVQSASSGRSLLSSLQECA